jgi:hypothetical protein
MLTISGPPEYYSPYPTLTTMKGQGGLADATSQKLAVTYRDLAKRLGVTMRPRPKKLSDADGMVWDILEGIDVAAAQLNDVSGRLFRMLAKGGAMCKDLQRYNRLAIKVYESQRGVIAELQKDGVKGIPLAPPWPPLFVGFGNHAAAPAESFWQIDCTEPIVQIATDQRPDGVKMMLRQPCASERGLQGVIALAIGAYVVGGLIGGLGYGCFKASVDKEKLRQETAQVVAALEQQRHLEELKEMRVDKCTALGGDYQACLESADQATPDAMSIFDIIESIKRERGGRGRSWLWWIGLAAVVVGGVVAFKMIKSRRLGRAKTQKLTRAEMIEA